MGHALSKASCILVADGQNNGFQAKLGTNCNESSSGTFLIIQCSRSSRKKARTRHKHCSFLSCWWFLLMVGIQMSGIKQGSPSKEQLKVVMVLETKRLYKPSAKGVFFSFLFLILSFLLVRPKGLTECRST